MRKPLPGPAAPHAARVQADRLDLEFSMLDKFTQTIEEIGSGLPDHIAAEAATEARGCGRGRDAPEGYFEDKGIVLPILQVARE